MKGNGIHIYTRRFKCHMETSIVDPSGLAGTAGLGLELPLTTDIAVANTTKRNLNPLIPFSNRPMLLSPRHIVRFCD